MPNGQFTTADSEIAGVFNDEFAKSYSSLNNSKLLTFNTG